MPVPSASAPEPGLKVAYVLKMFPRLSETFILNEILELERQGAQVTVFSLLYPADGRFHARVAELGNTIEYLPRDKVETYWDRLRDAEPALAPSFERLGAGADFLRRHRIQKDLDLLLRAACIAVEIRKRGIQHVHSHFATVATHVATLIHLLADVPFSFTSHAKDIFRETVNRELYAEMLGHAEFNVTVSDFNRSFLLEHTPGVDPKKIVRLYNGVDLSFFAPRERSAGEPEHVLSVGRMVPKKGFDVLLHALARVAPLRPDLRVTFIGDGPDLPALRALRDQLGLTERVELTGALPAEQVRERCRAATLMALACIPDQDGNMDALPTVLLEALACDVPLVSTRLTGVPEIVSEDVGRVVPPGDAESLAEALLEMTGAGAGSVAPGVARTRAEALFDLRANVARLHRMFRGER